MRAVMHERVMVRRIGVDLGSREIFVHPSALKSPVSPNTPRKKALYGIHERAGAGEVDEPGLTAIINHATASIRELATHLSGSWRHTTWLEGRAEGVGEGGG